MSTTNTELNAMAAPAIIGFSNPAAATGTAIVLYANAQNRFDLMVCKVARESRSDMGIARISERISTISEACTATSVPEPIAMPRSARAKAGASFTPSPTIATR